MRKNSLYLLIGLLAISFAFTSCLDDENSDYELTSDALVSAFSIGDIAMTDTVKTKDGKKDSVVYYTVPASNYKFTIDQQRGKIYNNDSLPAGINVKKVTTTFVVSYGYALTYLKNGQEMIWTASDSIDFTKPVNFKVYALDGSTRPYEVKLNVHQQDPDSLQWAQMKASDLNIPANAKQKAVYCNGTMYIFVQETTGNVKLTTSTDGLVWTALQTLNLQDADYTSAIQLNGKLYILSGKQLYASANGTDWTLVGSTSDINRLLAASPKQKQLYALSANQIISIAAVDGHVETIGTNDGNLPETNLSYAVSALSTNKSIEKLILVGARHATSGSDTTAVVWTKLSNEMAWTYYPQASNNTLGCPKLKNLSMIGYDGKLYAFGGANDYSTSSKYAIKAFQYLYKSEDGGISWHPQTLKVTFPKDFLGRENEFSYLVDEEDFIWFFWSPTEENGKTEVWRGRINHLGFDK